MTSVTILDEHLTVGPSVEAYNLEIADAQTLETRFQRIIAVLMTPEETQSASQAMGYSLGTGNASGQITFSVSGTATYSVLVVGYR